MNIFLNLLERGKMDESLTLSDGSRMAFEKSYPLDAAFDTMADVPAEILENKRYKERGDFSIAGVLNAMVSDFGPQPLDIVVHSLANGPEVKKPLPRDQPRRLPRRVSVSAYSLTSMVRLQSDHAGRRLVPLPDIHGGGAGGPGIRRRHVERQGGARGRHPDPRL